MTRSALFAFAFAACGGVSGDDLGDGMMELPPLLQEVSGVVAVDAQTLACVQDEKGVIVLVDLTARSKPRAIVFGERGDYEGVARVGDDYWVLRSDGRLLQIREQAGEWRIVATVRVSEHRQEWESLCYDAQRGRLLVLPKDGVGKDKDARDLRPMLAIDPANTAVAPEVIATLSRRAFQKQAETNGINLPKRTTDKGKVHVELDLACSELLALPDRRGFLVLSASDGVLLRVDVDGRLLACRQLDRTLLPQPEGMAWLADGRLVIASEGGAGGTGRARLLVVAVP